MSRRVKIQIALDLLDLDAAIAVLRSTVEYVDIIEVGTPLIKNVGMKSINAFREICESRLLIADMKTMDNGAMEIEMALREGADGVTIQAAAPKATVAAAYRACINSGKICCIDSLGLTVPQFFDCVAAYESCKPVLHVGVDQQAWGDKPTDLAAQAMKLHAPKGCSIAGGVNATNFGSLLELPFVDTLIVGSAVVRDKNPRKRAFELCQIANRRGV